MEEFKIVAKIADPTIGVLLFSLAISASISFLFFFLHKSNHNPFSFFLLAFSFSLLGGGIGYLSGLSREGVVGDVLPAALVFLGLGAGYLFSQNPEKSMFSSVAVGCFALTLFNFYYLAASERTESEKLENDARFLEAEIEDIRKQCATSIISKDFLELSSAERKRMIRYCKGYAPFLD